MTSVVEAVREVTEELQRARRKFPPFQSMHEGAAVIREEHDEFWEDVKKNDWLGARLEAIQLAAMAIRFLVDLDKYAGHSRTGQALEAIDRWDARMDANPAEAEDMVFHLREILNNQPRP